MLLESKQLILTRQGASPLTFPDLQLKRGEKTLLLGASGTGKTTLLSMIAGFLKPTTGQIVLDGQDIYALPSRERDRLRGQHFGFIFQTLHLLPALTLRQNIALAEKMAGRKAEEGRVDLLLTKLDIMEKAARKPSSLSQGEAQRGAIARAVLLKPDLLIADEPTSALDDTNAAAVIDLLEEQATECNATLLIATHDQRLTSRFSNVIDLTAAPASKQSKAA